MMTLIEMLLWSSSGFLALIYFSYYCLMVYEAKKPSNIRKQKIFPKVSLVIPTYNEEMVIVRKLENVKNLDYPKEKLEVLVVDSGSSDTTCQMIQKFIHQSLGEINLRLITQPQRMGKASALNFVWQHCHGEVVIISDADAIFEKKSVAKLVQNFGDPMVGAVTGKLFILNADQSPATRLEKSYRGIYEILRVGESNMDSTPIFNGPIVAFRKELLDELDSNTVADDTELSLKIREKGWKAIYDSEALAYEYSPTKFKLRVKQKIRRGQGIIQSFIRHKKMLFNPKYGKYGLVIFPCEFFMHVISPILVVLAIMLALITIALEPSVLVPFMSGAILVLIMSGLMLLVQRIFLAQKQATINPIDILGTFLNLQACLVFSLFSFLMRKTSHKWEKIREVRSPETIAKH